MREQVNKINSCEVCNNKNLTSVLDLGMHPMCDDLVSFDESRACKEYPIEILFCNNCLTAHQRYQVPKQELFPSTYHYRSRFTADVLNGMLELIKSCEQRLGNLSGKRVLDIGCNDGSLLSLFKDKGSITIGIEPTKAYIDSEEKGHFVYNNFLSEDIANLIVSQSGKPDIITFTNVFAHIENLQEVLNSLKLLMAPHTMIVIENHYLGAVLDGNQFDTFYHEHPRTYSYNSFLHVARTLDVPLQAVEFPSRYGGNIRVFIGNIGSSNSHVDTLDLNSKENKFLNSFNNLRTNVDLWKIKKKALLQEMASKHGKLRCKAFPGRAAILVKLLNLNENIISAVYEKPGSLKIGHYLPGTNIPIYSDDELFALPDQSQPILNLAWHIPHEIRNYLIDNNYTGLVVDILDANDFTVVK